MSLVFTLLSLENSNYNYRVSMPPIPQLHRDYSLRHWLYSSPSSSAQQSSSAPAAPSSRARHRSLASRGQPSSLSQPSWPGFTRCRGRLKVRFPLCDRERRLASRANASATLVRPAGHPVRTL